MSSVIVTIPERVALSVTVIVEVAIDKEVTIEMDVYVVARAQVDGVTVIVVPVHEEGELVLLAEAVAMVEDLVEVVVTPAKQVQALVSFEPDAEHGDRKLGKEVLAVTRLAV
jgi:hypothetical protein